MSAEKVIIAGGGLGGLGAALGLAKVGKSVTVLEKAPELGEIGAGIQLGPNAFHSFDYLGVGKGAREQAVYIDMLRFMDAMTGEEVNHIPLDDAFRTRFGILTRSSTGPTCTRKWSRRAKTIARSNCG